MLVDRNGTAISLATELGRGGEGAVYEVAGRPDSVAKVYLKPPGAEHSAKLTAMLKANTATMAKLAAWPTDLVLDRGKTVGFLMPKVAGFRPAFELYGPKLRLQRFPKADWRFLIRASANTARAFAAVHNANQVIGDVNHGNLVIGQDATVRLIDCDSFQISANGQTWHCEVGVPTHQPPEMQGLQTYARVIRTPNHDAFGLAVLIFQMLCMARHPYSGRWQRSGDPPAMEEAIRQCYYAYATGQRSTPLAPPPGSLPMEAVGPTIRGLFDSAFLGGGVAPGGRPTAVRWVSALDELAASLRACPNSSGHHYLSSLRSCPWCELEGKSGISFFPVTFVQGSTGVDGFVLLWQQVEAVTLPSPRSRMPDPPAAKPSAEAKAAGRTRGAAFLSVVVLAIAMTFFAVHCATSTELEAEFLASAMGFCGAAVLCIHTMLGRSFRSARALYKPKWMTLQNEWRATSGTEKPAQIRKDLIRLKASYDALRAERNEKLQALQRNRQASQLRDYLDRFRITSAGIRGVGDGKAAVLQSYGIETAADIVEWKVLQISGFGPKTVANMVAWRDAHTKRFRFDPSKPVSASAVGAVENDFGLKRRVLERQLATGLGELRNAVAAEDRARAELMARHTKIAPIYGQVVADSKAALFYA